MRAATLRATLVVLVLASASWAQTITGKVVKVTDGDTITILIAGHQQEKVRLAEIDAPETRQAFGKQAKAALATLIAGQVVKVQSDQRDRYGRILGHVRLGDCQVNRWLVEQGWAWQYRIYSRDPTLARVEEEARADRRGLWADPNPMPPWEFRKAAKSKAVQSKS